MTSAVSRDDVQDLAFRYGIKDPRRLNDLMRLVDTYAYTLARKASSAELPPVDFAPDGRKAYLCRKCSERLPLGTFPEEKRKDPAKQFDCIPCGGADRREYKCPECEQVKSALDFPERKRENPTLRVLCSWCEPRKITRNDAGYVRNH